MAINVSFAGSTIYRPGAYSRTTIDLGGGFPLGPTGLIAIFGEAEAGTPGSEEINIANNFYSPEQMQSIRQKYGSGPIVDACQFLFSPGADGAIPAGAQAVYIYKTNASVRASSALPTDFGTVKALEYGVGGNRISIKNTLSAEISARVVSSATFDLTAAAFASGDTFSIRVDGSKLYTFEFPADCTDWSELDTALKDAANWDDAAALTEAFEVVQSDAWLADDTASVLFKIKDEASLVPVATHKIGRARCLELIDGVNAPLAKMNIADGFITPSSPAQSILVINQKRDLISETDTVGGNVVISASYVGATTDNASIIVNDTQVKMVVNAVETIFIKSAYVNIQALVADMNIQPGWAVIVNDLTYNALPVEALDYVTARAASSLAADKPARIMKDVYDVLSFFDASQLAYLELPTVPAEKGLPDAKIETMLLGGLKGATATAEITNALVKFEKIRVNNVIPLFSRDAAADASDLLTDPTSSYTIAGIHQATKSHISKMVTIKNRSERMSNLSIKDTYQASKEAISNISYERIQMSIQEIRQSDSLGVIKWFQPWALSCLMAGARSGSPIGTPMTYKFLNMSGLRHTGTLPMSTPEQNIVVDFDPDLQYEDAIKNGVTFCEAAQTGGYRVVLDNTSYNKDGNWVYNRANVLYAADILVYDFRNQLERIYVGIKNTIRASEVSVMCESILRTYLAQGITVKTSDAANGYKALVVQINGNTINISVTVKLVEGIDFILSDITVQRAQQ